MTCAQTRTDKNVFFGARHAFDGRAAVSGCLAPTETELKGICCVAHQLR